MKLKKWVLKLLTFINVVSMIMLASLNDFELCFEALGGIALMLFLFGASSILLLRYGGYEK